jgi:hypothetical protein
MNEITKKNQRLIRCDLCKLGVLWVPVESGPVEVGYMSPGTASDIERIMAHTKWIYVAVADQPLAICPTCQMVARALQIADVERSQPNEAGNSGEAKP